MSEFHVMVGLMCALIAVILGAYGFAARATAEARKDSEERVKRVYERFDEYKKNIEGRIERTCVVKDMCAVLHTNSDANIKRLEDQMTRGFDRIYTKIEEMQKAG